MAKIDLFHPVERSVYGTATPMDIPQVHLAALLFCAAAAAVFSIAAYFLTSLAG